MGRTGICVNSDCACECSERLQYDDPVCGTCEIEHAALTEALDALAGMVRRECWLVRNRGTDFYAPYFNSPEHEVAIALLTRHGRMRETEPGRFVFTGANNAETNE